MRSTNSARIPVGISQCLIGDPVRFNAGHKHSRLCTEQLGALFELRKTMGAPFWLRAHIL